jgi:hypothetical protein
VNATPKVRILFLAANPESTSRLDLEEELRSVETELRSVEFRDEIVLTAAHAVRPDDLVRLLRKVQPSIVHFSGHGSPDGIILRSETGHVAVHADSLARLFRERGVKLVVLNACFSDEQAEALAGAVDAVVGTTSNVSDEAARRFSTAFYRTLGDGYSVGDAFRDGGDAVEVHMLDDVFKSRGNMELVLCGAHQVPLSPPLGSILPPAESGTPSTSRPAASAAVDRALLMSLASHGIFFIPLKRVETGDVIALSLSPVSPQQSAFLATLRRDRDQEVGVAFALTGFLGKLTEARQEYRDSREQWHLTFTSGRADYGAGFMEMSTSGYSADDIATLRARRILLDETRERDRTDTVGFMNDTTLEVLIRGMNTPIEAIASPLPDLFAETGHDRDAFLHAARLLLVLYLRLCGVVEHVFMLDLAFEDADRLRVKFEGQRARRYSNEPAPIIAVHGTCVLRRPSPG